MTTLLRVVELPFRVFGRPVRPFHLGLMIGTFATSYQVYVAHGAGLNVGDAIFYGAIISATMLWLGWVMWPWRLASAWLSGWGALLAMGVWSARGAWVVLADQGLGVARSPVLSAVLSLAWVFVAFGIWLMEQSEQDSLRDGGEGE